MHRSCKRFTAIPLILVILLTGCARKQNFDAEEILNPEYSEVISKVDEYLAEKKFQGAVLLSKKKEIIYAKGIGDCDSKASQKTPITINTTFEIGSVTKQITAAAVMQLQEKGKLSVNDKLSKYFPEYQYGEDITIKMLLNMRSGLTDYINDPFEYYPRKVANKIEQSTVTNKKVEDDIVLKYFYSAPLFIKPDSSYFYCNTNYYLLAKIIEQASGVSYNEYVQENIFKPCGMTNSNTDFQATDTKGYDWKKRYCSFPKDYALGCGNINSTVVDLYKWNNCFFNNKVVSKKSFKEMTDTESYGYGLNVQNGEIFHAGATQVFNAYSTYYPKDKITIVVLINKPQNQLYAAEIARSIYKLTK